jgi:membrane protease YdiL (CAAX protease family)
MCNGASGRLVLAGHPDRVAAESGYRQRFAKVTLSTQDPMVLIDLAPGPATASGGLDGSGRVSRPGVVARHPLLWFITVAYAWAWVWWLPLLADRQDWVSWSVSPYLHLAGALGPAIAAVFVTAAVSGREGLRDLVRRTVAWRGRLPWLALALLAPLVLFAVAILAARLVDGAWPDLDRFGASTEYPALPLVGYWLASLLFYGYGEEIGWRGFLQPALQQRRSALVAAVAVSVVWAGWHLPLFGITAGYRNLPVVGFVGFYLSLLVAALVLAWLYLRSNGSLLVVAVFHAGYDIVTNTPTSTTLIPILMGAAITVAGLATIPALRTARPTADRAVAVATMSGGTP